MSTATRSPRARKSVSLAERDLNLDHLTLPVTNKDFKAKKRGAVSVGGEGLGNPTFQIGKASDELSPKRKARRHLQPRKSILKSLNARNDDTEDTAQYAHTISFSASQTLISRRVSFAPNAHVRMFEKSPAVISPNAALAQGVNLAFSTLSGSNASRSSSSHSRRSSIQNLGSVSKPNIFAPSVFQGEGETLGEESMDIEEDVDSNSEDDDEGTVEMGRQFNGQQGNFSFGTNGSVQQQGAYIDNVESDNEELDMEEEEMDMDMTHNVYGGIIRRPSIAPSTAGNETLDSDITEEANISTRSADEEKTMDFTIAVGGLLPPQAPAGAMSNRQSIGYSFPIPEGSNAVNFRPGDAIEGEVEMEMEETVAFGGIIGPDDSLSSAEDTINSNQREKTMTFTFNHSIHPPQSPQEDDNDGMDMTVAQGGIISLPPPSSPYPPVSPGRSLQYPPISPGRSLPTNTRPMSGTPSFARPTVSSVQKSTSTTQKRNVFAPSPSPTKSTTPKKIGMQVAGEVAKRLSFGAPTPTSANKKRTREDETAVDVAHDASENVKKAKLDLTSGANVDTAAEEVFGGTPVSQPAIRTSLGGSRRSLGAARASLGTPMRVAMSPAARKSLVRVADPEPEMESEEVAVQPEEEQAESEWEQPQILSLNSFLDMAGVQFMEGLPGLNRRRSSVGKGILGQSYSGGEREFALHDYTEAQVNYIFLNMYTWAASKLREDIRNGQEELDSTEARCDEESPQVIQEYLSATDEDKELFESTFKTFKTNTHLKAKELWYNWKLQLMDTIKPDVESMLEEMQEDNDRLTALQEQTESILPDLTARQAALQAELEKERQIVAEIAACDQQELISLKEGIAEQGTQIKDFNFELGESTAKLTALTTKLEELNKTKRECISAIQHAKSQCDQFTKSDAIRLQEEYNSIQHLHLWRPTKTHSNLLELEYDNEILLTFECKDYIANLDSAKIFYLYDKSQKLKKGGIIIKNKNNNQNQIITATEGLFGMIEIAVREIVKARTFNTLSSLVQRIGQLWSSSQRIKSELNYVNFRYPVEFHLLPEDNLLLTNITIILPQIKSKIIIDLSISQETIWGYPLNLNQTDLNIRKIYGKADIDLLNSIAKETISSIKPQNCLGAFIEVCIEVAKQYIK